MEIEVRCLEDFENLLDNPDREMIISMLKSIDDGIKNNTDTVKIFDINFTGSQQQFTVYLSKAKWPKILKQLLKMCEKHSYNDEAIDAYLLDKKYKETYNAE